MCFKLVNILQTNNSMIYKFEKIKLFKIRNIQTDIEKL